MAEISCEMDPCKNGGTCTDGADKGYTCQCDAVYTGENCETGMIFLSPARRGRGILVAPGFCTASGVKTTGQYVLKFYHHIPSNMGMSKWFFRDATKIQNGRQMSTLKFFVGAKTLKLIQISLSHSPWYGDVQVTFSRFYWNSKWPPQINFDFLGGVETQKICLVNFFWNFNITFLATWGCASDFLKMLPNFKMAARGQLQIFLWAQKLQILNLH